MTTPRLEIDLDKVERNASCLVERLSLKGVAVMGVTKACLGLEEVAQAMVRGGVSALGDSRIASLETMGRRPGAVPLRLLRTPMISEAARTVAAVEVSYNTELDVISELSVAASEFGRTHGVVLMVELGDLREGIMPRDLERTVRRTRRFPRIELRGIGANLACRSGVVPDDRNMRELTDLAESMDAVFGPIVEIVSGGNSANLPWLLACAEVGRINELRLGESILLGREPLHRERIEGLHTDAFTLVAEVIEEKVKPARPWGEIAQAAFGRPDEVGEQGDVRQVILALGRQDVDPAGLTPPAGLRILGASSDHLIVDAGRRRLPAGTEVPFQLNYSALLRAMTSPFVTKIAKASPADDLGGPSRLAGCLPSPPWED